MAKTYTIFRASIFTFLQNFQHFTSNPSLFALPFAISTLVSQSLISSSTLFPLVHARLTSLFLVAGFSPSSEFFTVFNLKLSQTILGFFFVLPFTLSSLLITKTSIIRLLHHDQDQKFSFWIAIFNPLFVTQLCNSLLILSANATTYGVIVILFGFIDVLNLSSPKFILFVSAIGVVMYSIVLANAYVVCNLSSIISGTEKRGGFISILKACLLVRGRNGTALSLAVMMNLALAAVEALFQYRVVRAYNRAMATDLSMVFEGILIAYLYAILVVLDTIVGCLFLKRCKDEQEMGNLLQKLRP